MSEEPRKRSRFDQTEADPRRSRFDRRSRSPSNRDSEARRSRSPLAPPHSGSPASTEHKDPAAAAAAAAAKINAQIQARKGIQHVDVPPIRSVCVLSFFLSFSSASLYDEHSYAHTTQVAALPMPYHPLTANLPLRLKALLVLNPPPLGPPPSMQKSILKTETTFAISRSTTCATATL